MGLVGFLNDLEFNDMILFLLGSQGGLPMKAGSSSVFID
jgi:hypothetical protein